MSPLPAKRGPSERNDAAGSRKSRMLDGTARAALLGAIAVAPWLFGATEARTQFWLFAVILAVLACVVIRVLQRRGTAFVPWAAVPLICVLALGSFQLLPLPPGVGAWLSPGAEQFRLVLLPNDAAADEVPAAGEVSSTWQPISLFPASTRRDLALLVLATVVFMVSAAFFSHGRYHVWLYGVFAVNGAALAFFGIAQQLSWNGKIYWTFALSGGGAPFSSYVNRNNAAGFLNLCLAGGTVSRARHPRRQVRVEGIPGRSSREHRPGYCAGVKGCQMDPERHFPAEEVATAAKLFFNTGPTSRGGCFLT